jgi:hypothetical protein
MPSRRGGVAPSPLEAMRNSSVESSVMAHSGMMAASEPSYVGERLRPPKQSAMNSRLPK